MQWETKNVNRSRLPTNRRWWRTRSRPVLAMVAWAMSILASLGTCAGCAGRTEEDYIPAPVSARKAVEAAMDAWRRGETPGRIPGTPAIQVGDAHRRPGQILVSYEVLGEVPSSDGRTFAVRVKLDNPPAEEKVNFLVIGIDPLWVFREEDYKMATHWEHNMTPVETAPDGSQKQP